MQHLRTDAHTHTHARTHARGCSAGAVRSPRSRSARTILMFRQAVVPSSMHMCGKWPACRHSLATRPLPPGSARGARSRCGRHRGWPQGKAGARSLPAMCTLARAHLRQKLAHFYLRVCISADSSQIRSNMWEKPSRRLKTQKTSRKGRSDKPPTTPR